MHATVCMSMDVQIDPSGSPGGKNDATGVSIRRTIIVSAKKADNDRMG